VADTYTVSEDLDMALIDLGYSIAKLEKIERTPHSTVHSLKIVTPSADEENHYTPAESVTIYGKPALIALRDALNEVYPADADTGQGGQTDHG